MKNRENLFALAAFLIIIVLVALDQMGATGDSAQRAVEGIKLTSAQVEDVERSTGEVSRLITGEVSESEARDRLSDLFELALGVKIAHAQSPGEPVNRVTGEEGESGSMPQSSYQTDLNHLYDRWTPTYRQAMYDLVKFEERFSSAIALTGAYLEEQRALTETIGDPALRAEQEKFDHDEREAVSRWVSNGGALLSEMLRIRSGLEDMNVIITKQQLRVEFLSENAALYQIPESARQLHNSLDSFKDESDSLARRLQTEVFSK